MTFAKLPVLLLSAGVCAFAGCAALDPKYPMEVQVSSALTGEPLAGVPVSTDYTGKVADWPEGDSGVTDRDGRLLLPVADFNRGVTTLHVGEESVLLGNDVVREGFSTKPNGDKPIEKAYRVRLTPKPPSVASLLGIDLILSSDPTAGSPFDDKTFHSGRGQ
jgi:hypothetical protein